MRCSHCGAILESDSLYCKVCGCELQIVPDYDPLDELVIEQSQESKATDNNEKLNSLAAKDTLTTKNVPVQTQNFLSLNKFFWMFGIIILCFLAFLSAYFSMSKENNYDYQLKKGLSHMKEQEYEDALPFLKKAQEIQKDSKEMDASPLRYLAKAYAFLDYPEMVISCMEEAISIEEKTHKNNGVLEELYLEYMDLLNQSSQTDHIPNVLESCEDEEIRLLLLPYMIEKPSCDMPEGEYGYYIKLELNAPYGTIYYTLDGTEPTAESARYEGPISLEKGETLLSAVAINKKGMISDKLVLVYKLNFDNQYVEDNDME